MGVEVVGIGMWSGSVETDSGIRKTRLNYCNFGECLNSAPFGEISWTNDRGIADSFEVNCWSQVSKSSLSASQRLTQVGLIEDKPSPYGWWASTNWTNGVS